MEYLLEFDMLDTLENLIRLARERKLSPIDRSYTNKLHTDKSLRKSKVIEKDNEFAEAAVESAFQWP